MKAIVWTAIIAGAGGYAAAVFTWDKVHTWWIGAEAKLTQLRQKARDLEAKIKAVF